MLQQLSIGLSGMRAAQIGLDVTGNNLANANTPGYRRQTPLQAEVLGAPFGALQRGQGVEVQQIRQAKAELVGRQLFQNVGDQAETRAVYDLARQIEARLNPSSGSVSDQFDTFNSALEGLAAAPFDSALRSTALQSGLSLTRQVNRIAADFNDMDKSISGRLGDAISEVNVLASRIADLNLQIHQRQQVGQQPNTLIDQRNAVAEELSRLVSVDVDERSQQVFIGNGIVIGTKQPRALEFDGENVRVQGAEAPLELGGLIGGLQRARNELLPVARQRLDDFALGLAQTFDALHLKGVGTEGHLTELRSSRPVSDPNIPLRSNPTDFPLQQGRIHVGVKDLATGERRLDSIDFDPAVESLTDLATKLSGIAGVESFVDGSNRLVLRSQSGYGFDLSGRPSSKPDVSGLTSSATPSLSGQHQGANRTVEFEFLGNGDIGVTPGLQVEARDAATGESLGVFDVGEGYPPGDALFLPGGVSLSLSVGTTVAGETFSAELVSEPDTTGAMVRLGMNTLFSGSNALDITISDRLLEDPSQLGASLSGEPGNSDVIAEMLGKRFDPLPGGLQTLDDLLYDATGAIGHETNSLELELEGLTLIGEELFVEREGIEGVDPNEELTELLKYQRSFEASARYVTVIDRVLDDLLSIVR